jgi:nucleotide-binding universal stress UspA family protein
MAGKIFVPLDGTAYAEQIVPLVAELAKKSAASVALVSIIDPEDLDVTETAGEGDLPPRGVSTAGSGAGMNMRGEGAGGVTGMVWMAPIGSPSQLSKEEAAALDSANRETRAYLGRIEKKLGDRGISASADLGFGNPDHEIVEEAAKAGATMIAMTARSKSFWERGALGSTADRVIHASPMPVLVLKPMEGTLEHVSVVPDTVVVGLDGSKQAEGALGPAAEFAAAMGAKLALAHVLKRDNGMRREAATNYLASVAGTLKGEVVSDVVNGSADEEIILYADRFKRPLIALTKHGGGGIGKWLRGSTTDKVIRNAGYPVLVVPVGH